jgi:predicted HicB family RNase H-like nuclease
MTKPKDHGVSADGTVLTDEVLERVAAEAEVGYDVEEILKRRGRGRPPLGEAAAESFPVRLDPQLRASVAARAERDGVAQSEVIRRALRQYLEV